MKRKYSNCYLINTLKDYAVNLGRTPTYTEFENDRSVPSATKIKERFGTWNNALKLAGLKLNANRIFLKEEIIEEALKFYKVHKRAPFFYELNFSLVNVKKFWDGWTDFIKSIGLPPNYNYSQVTSEEELKKFLINLYQESGDIPKAIDAEVGGLEDICF